MLLLLLLIIITIIITRKVFENKYRCGLIFFKTHNFSSQTVYKFSAEANVPYTSKSGTEC